MVTTNDASRLQSGQAQYSLFCNNDGGIIDDAIVYMLAENHYLICVNASNADKDYSWIKGSAGRFKAEVTNTSDNYAQLAVQGPKAIEILDKVTGKELDSIRHFCFDRAEIGGGEAIFSRTGYTGEDGFEIYLPKKNAPAAWESIMESGKEFGIKPIGLGARDTLRLEMKYALYGNDIDDGTSPLEANLGWVVKFHKREFIGKEALLKQKENGVKRKLVCLEMNERGIPRKGYEIFSGHSKIGHVTSGTMSPSLGNGIAMGYVALPFNETGSELYVVIRGKELSAKVISPPFYKKL